MKSRIVNELRLWEDEKEFEPNGTIKHHPLNSRWFYGDVVGSYGHLTFAGHNLDQSPLFDDVHVYYLEFSGDPDDPQSDREGWADPIRIEVLKKLAGEQYHWYLSFVGALEDPYSPNEAKKIDDDLRTGLLQNANLASVVVQSEYSYMMELGFYNRLFFEVTNPNLPYVVNRYWPNADQLFPIEGYLFEPGRIELFKVWNIKPRNDVLFKEVIDQVQCAFYTIAGQNRHFVFITNKWTIEDLENIIDLKALQILANNISDKQS